MQKEWELDIEMETREGKDTDIEDTEVTNWQGEKEESEWESASVEERGICYLVVNRCAAHKSHYFWKSAGWSHRYRHPRIPRKLKL